MKKLFSVMVIVVLLFGIAQNVEAGYINDTKLLCEGLHQGDTFTWHFNLPSDFSVPYDIVNYAKLTILTSSVDTSGNTVTVENSFLGYLNTNNIFTWGTSYDLKNMLSAGWSSGNTIDVSIKCDDDYYWRLFGLHYDPGYIYLALSSFEMCYTNVDAPVPEPCSMLLLGSGLIGMAALRKKLAAG